MEESRCINCIWYEQCVVYNNSDSDLELDLELECDYFDPIHEEDEVYWTEMSYYKYRKE